MIDIDELEYAANGCEFDEDLLGITAIECKSIASELRRLESMNKELLEALEGVIDYLTFEGFGGTYIGIREDADITEDMKPFLDVIAKAKGTTS